MRYFITFACYGAHLHGDESGSVDRRHNLPGSRVLEPNIERATADKERMTQVPYLLNAERRTVVLESLKEHCVHCGWNLLAAHVRTNHVHVVLESEAPPERVMNAFKSYASRALLRFEIDGSDRKRWARHGSTRWLWTDRNVAEAIRYVVDEQGEPMAVFVSNVG